MQKYKCQNCFRIFYGYGAKFRCPLCGGSMKEITGKSGKSRGSSRLGLNFCSGCKIRTSNFR